MSDKALGYVYLTLSMLLVGSTVIASKIAASGLPPFSATALRFAIALPCFVVLLRITGEQSKWPRPSARDWVLLLTQAIAGSVGYTALLISGLRGASAADAGVILGTLPIVSALFAVLVLGERPDRALMATIALAVAGVFILVWQPHKNGPTTLGGNALILGAVACEAIFILMNKRLHASISPLSLSTLMTAVGLTASLPLALIEGPWPAASLPAIAAVAYYALVPTVGGFLLWYAGAARVSGAEAALFTAIAPVAALLGAVVILGEPLGWQQAGGMGLVLTAVCALGWTRKRAAKA